MKARAKPPRLTYASLEEDPSCEHAVDRAVRIRVGRRDLDRKMADASTAIVKALGKKRRLWFNYERAEDERRARREAAYFDVGVEHGVATARSERLHGGSKSVEKLVGRLVREALGAGVAREDAVGAAVWATWALLGGRTAQRPSRQASGRMVALAPSSGSVFPALSARCFASRNRGGRAGDGGPVDAAGSPAVDGPLS